MPEAILDTAHDFGCVPQWKRELLQRRAQRGARAAPSAQPPPSPPPLPPPDEELSYGPGIVKRLQTRYLSLALRTAAPPAQPLRRAASLEHLAPPPPPQGAHQPRRQDPPPDRLERLQRARSVEALERVPGRSANRVPRRPRPLLGDGERPPPHLVRTALQRLEAAKPPDARRPPSGRVASALRELDRRTATPERSPDREPRPSPFQPVRATPPPPLVIKQPRRVGVIRPLPPRERTPPPEPKCPSPPPKCASPPPKEPSPPPEICLTPPPRCATPPKAASPPPPPATATLEVRKIAKRPPATTSVGVTSVVFNFSHRKEVPDHVASSPSGGGWPRLLDEGDGDAPDEAEGGPPSPLAVRFVNDNVLINGRSSLQGTPRAQRNHKLKLQFDESLTRTFEYPSESSLSEEGAAAPLGGYTPHKTRSDPFQLGVSPPPPPPAKAPPPPEPPSDAWAAAHCWSEARAHSADLLF